MMDINILLILQDFRNGIGSVFTGFLTKMSLIGEMEVVLVIIALIYWCVNKGYGTYFLMGWSGNRVVNGLLKVTACVYRPWIRNPRGYGPDTIKTKNLLIIYRSGGILTAERIY